MGSSRDVYEQAMKLYSAGDLDGFANCYTEDATLITPDGTAQGRAAIREQWGREQAAFPDRTVTAHVIFEQGDTVATEFTWAGTNTGSLYLPDGTELPPTGKRIENGGMDLAQVRDGKIAVHRGYWDNVAIASQLGLLSALSQLA